MQCVVFLKQCSALTCLRSPALPEKLPFLFLFLPRSESRRQPEFISAVGSTSGSSAPSQCHTLHPSFAWAGSPTNHPSLVGSAVSCLLVQRGHRNSTQGLWLKQWPPQHRQLYTPMFCFSPWLHFQKLVWEFLTGFSLLHFKKKKSSILILLFLSNQLAPKIANPNLLLLK